MFSIICIKIDVRVRLLPLSVAAIFDVDTLLFFLLLALYQQGMAGLSLAAPP